MAERNGVTVVVVVVGILQEAKVDLGSRDFSASEVGYTWRTASVSYDSSSPSSLMTTVLLTTTHTKLLSPSILTICLTIHTPHDRPPLPTIRLTIHAPHDRPPLFTIQLTIHTPHDRPPLLTIRHLTIHSPHDRPPLLTIHPHRTIALHPSLSTHSARSPSTPPHYPPTPHTGSDKLSDSHGRARHRCNLQPSAPRRDRLRCGYRMQEGGPGPWASSTKPFAASLPSTRALPHAPSTTTHPLSTHPTTTTHAPITGAIPAPPREHAPSEPYLPSVPPAQAHHRATDADLLRSGELVDEPGPGAGPRRAHPSLHHVRPASVLRVPCSWCHISPAWLCMLLAAPIRARAKPLNRSGRSVCADTPICFAADFAAFNTHRPVQHGGVRLRRRVKVPSWWIVRPCCASSGTRLAAMSAAWHAQGEISRRCCLVSLKARLELSLPSL